MNVKECLEYVTKVDMEAKKYMHAAGVLQYDMETICPSAAMEEEGEVSSFLANKAYELKKDDKYIENMEYLYEHREELGDLDNARAYVFHRDFEKEKNITPKMQLEFSNVYNKGFVAWLDAKSKSDFGLFSKALSDIKDVEMKTYNLCDKKYDSCYDFLFDRYEEGVTSKDLDEAFGAFKDRIIPLLKNIQNSKKKIRTDFMSRKVTDAEQMELSQRIMDLIGMDKDRRALSLSEHPFTDGYSYSDVRITTHFYEDNFASSMYSIIHEGGHALFEMFQPKENFEHFLNDKTMGQHESVSRFYENIIGRSKGFVHLIYPIVKEVFKGRFNDVTEEELYEALNLVTPSLVRTEADELTYTFHIIIRYEIEKMIVNEGYNIEDLPKLWNEKYKEYLGIDVPNDKEGVLQDMHWASGFGYFPTYALGNMYNSMYYNKMKEDMDVEKEVSEGHMDKILAWMSSHVFAKADRMAPKDWIKDITGRNFTPNDFLDYLEDKYTKIYEL